MSKSVAQVILFFNEVGSKFTEITSNEHPLPLIPIANRPLITYHLELIKKLGLESKKIKILNLYTTIH